jgi:signal transduction histidine kinase
MRQRKTAELVVAVPEFTEVLHSQDRVELSLVLLASVVFLLGVFAVTVLETHRTAGALVNLSKRLKDIELGRYSARLRLRRTDNMRGLEAAFDGMSRALQERAWARVEALEALAAQAESSDSSPAARELALQLHALADAERRLAD